MKNFFGMSKNKDDKENDESRKSRVVDNDKLLLRKEELDIAKNRVQVGEVEISKEIIEEQKVEDVPVIHEEVVIERRALGNEPSDSPIGEEETIHIPVSEDRIEVGKHTMVTGEVVAHKREVEETKQVRETLKREEARVKKDGDPNIVADEKDDLLH